MNAQLAGVKVVIIIPQFFREGATRQAFLLARALKHKHGLTIEVWALFYPGECQKEFEDAGIPTRVLGFVRPQCPMKLVRTSYWVSRLGRIARTLRRHRVDVLLPMTGWANVIAGLTYRLGGVGLCIWGERSSGTDRVRMERLALRQYKSFVANSSGGVDFLTGTMGVARSRISLIPNAVEAPEETTADDWRDRLGLAPGQLTVLKIANLTRYRDHATLLHTWKIVQQDWQSAPPPLLVLAGAFGDASREVQRFVREAQLETTIRFVGAVKDASALIQTSDLCVFSSRAEGMPNSVLEYMAVGKAVVATDLPGIRDALGPAAGEALAPAGDAQTLASCILGFLRNSEQRKAAGEQNKRRALSEFSVERMAQAYLAVMEKHARRPLRASAGEVPAVSPSHTS